MTPDLDKLSELAGKASGDKSTLHLRYTLNGDLLSGLYNPPTHAVFSDTLKSLCGRDASNWWKLAGVYKINGEMVDVQHTFMIDRTPRPLENSGRDGLEGYTLEKALLSAEKLDETLPEELNFIHSVDGTLSRKWMLSTVRICLMRAINLASHPPGKVDAIEGLE